MANQITINYLPCEPSPFNGYLVKYRPVGSMEAFRTWPTNFFPSPAELLAGIAAAVFVTDDDPDGTQYEGEVYGDCGNGGLGVGSPWSTADESSASDSTPCTPVQFVEGSVPDAINGEAYSVDLHLTGTGPFALESVTKPAWMTVTLVGSTIELRGTPSSVGTDEDLIIVASNCGGDDNDTFTDTLDVTDGPCGSYDLLNTTDDPIDISYTDCDDVFHGAETVAAHTSLGICARQTAPGDATIGAPVGINVTYNGPCP